MFKKAADEKKFIREHYTDISNSHIDDEHWDLECSHSKCNVVRGFQVVRKGYTTEHTRYHTDIDYQGVRTVVLRCPVCESYKMLIVFKLPSGQGHKWYRVAELPSSGIESLEDLPEKPPELRKAYLQAVKAMSAGAYIAAVVMYRRALQVITRDIGKAKKDSLANELSELTGKKINGVTFTQDFSDVGYIVKEAGNQGAHPDDDPDLLDFTQQDAEDLHSIFISMVAELFVAPRAAKEAKERFKQNRKIN